MTNEQSTEKSFSQLQGRRTLLKGLVGVAGAASLGAAIFSGERMAFAQTEAQILPAVVPGQQLYSIKIPGFSVDLVDWSPDKKKILADLSNNDTTTGAYKTMIWDAATGKLLRTVNRPYGKSVWAPDSIRVASSGGKGLVVWNANTGAVLYDVAASSAGAWSRNGRWIAGGGSYDVYIHDAVTGRKVSTFHFPRPAGSDLALEGLDFSPDSKYIASQYGDDDAEGDYIAVWELATGKLITTIKRGIEGGLGLDWSPDGKLIASATGSDIGVWEALTGRKVKSFKIPAWNLTWAPGGNRIVAQTTQNGTITFEVATGKTIFTFRAAPNTYLHDLNFEPGGQRLATAETLMDADLINTVAGFIRVWQML